MKMMRNMYYFVVFVVLLSTFSVKALSSTDKLVTERKECPKFELATANEDDTITHKECYENYNDAKKAMNEDEDQSLMILERIGNITKIIDAKYGLVYLDRGDVLTYLYSNCYLNNSITYMNNSSTYGATEGALIDINYSNKAAKIKIGGVVGWVRYGEYSIVPAYWIKSRSYYKIDDNYISHYYAKNVEVNNYYQASRILGPRPDFDIENKTYWSYDGIYFYDNFFNMIDDYKENSNLRSNNKDNAYYNYYLYLPHRSKTNYTIDDFDSYIRNVLNFGGSAYGRMLSTSEYFSVIYGTSEYFQYSEKMYGANALSVFSLSRNESANGRSYIAYNKNNIFGHNAIDGAAYSSATGYLDIRSSIYNHGYGYINYGYARVSDYRYNGSHFGNKNAGMNVMYASDVFWGEKAAGYYYEFDRANGMLDYNYYQLIVSKKSGINVRTAPNTSASIAYQVKKEGIPFILVEEVAGSEFNGNNIWYKIQSDSNISTAGTLIGSSKEWPTYNWDGYVYVHSSYFDKINDAKKEDGTYNAPSKVEKDVNNYNIITNATNSTYTPIVGMLESDTDYFYTSTLLNKKGSIKKGNYVVILEKVETLDTISYLVITDYSKNQKAWINGENVKIVNKDLLAVSIIDAGGYIDVLDKNYQNSLLKVYNGNFLPIVGKEETSGKTYLKVIYKTDGSIGYVDSSLNKISYTLKYLNNKPVIEANDISIIQNEEFDVLKGVKAIDTEDGDITKNIKVTGMVDTKIPGEYGIIYSVTDSYGDTVTKEIKVVVIKLVTSDALFMFNSLKHVSNNTFEFSGFMGIKGIDNKNVKTSIIFLNQDTLKEYYFSVGKWEDYPYEMSSIDDKEKHDYSGGWFKENIDLTTLPNGDYTIYVYTINGNKESKTLFTNIAYMDMTRRAKGSNKEFLIEVDYSTLNSPLLFSIRGNLIGKDEPKTFDPMYNFFNEISLNNDNLTIKGTSHNIGINYGEKDDVIRKLVLENKKTFERFEFNLGSIINGDYPITLAVSDNCDKTRAWYLNTIDLSSVPKGEYVLYIKNTVNNVTYYGEIIDVAYTDFSKINNNKYNLVRNDNLRLRLELIKK